MSNQSRKHALIQTRLVESVQGEAVSCACARYCIYKEPVFHIKN